MLFSVNSSATSRLHAFASFFASRRASCFAIPGAANFLMNLFYRSCALREPMQQQHRCTVFAEEVQHPVTGFSHPQPCFAKFALDLPGVREIESRATLFEQVIRSSCRPVPRFSLKISNP